MNKGLDATECSLIAQNVLWKQMAVLLVYFAELFWGRPLTYIKTKYIFIQWMKRAIPTISYLFF